MLRSYLAVSRTCGGMPHGCNDIGLPSNSTNPHMWNTQKDNHKTEAISRRQKTYPVIGTTTSLRVFSLVTSINSPKPSAACSFVSADPLIKPWSSIQMCQISSCLKLILCYTFLHSKFKYVYTIINENAQINTCWNIGRKGCSALGRHKPGTRIGTPWKWKQKF